MNVLSGQIKSIKTSGDLSLVTVACSDIVLSAIVIDTPESAPYLREGRNVNVLFKETEVVISTLDTAPLSIQNKLTGIIQAIHEGVLLSKVILKTSNGSITAVITTTAIEALQLRTGATATALIKTNEIMLSD